MTALSFSYYAQFHETMLVAEGRKIIAVLPDGNAFVGIEIDSVFKVVFAPRLHRQQGNINRRSGITVPGRIKNKQRRRRRFRNRIRA
jgi:hypothetical protein